VSHSTTLSNAHQSLWPSFLGEQVLSLSGQPTSTVYDPLPENIDNGYCRNRGRCASGGTSLGVAALDSREVPEQ